MRKIWIKPRKLIVLIIILLTMVIGAQYGKEYVKRTVYPMKHVDAIKEYSKEFNIDPWLVVSVIWVESKFDNMATSSKDARGLMQVTPPTGEWAFEKLGLSDFDSELLYDPEINIRIGSWYLDNLRTEFDGSMELVLAAYNGGSGNVTEWLKDERYSDDGKTLNKIPFTETENYVKRVLDTYEKYKEIYGYDKDIDLD